MNETEIVTDEQPQPLATTGRVPSDTVPAQASQPAPDAKALRVGHIGKLLGLAYEGASTLKLNKQEQKDLRADFPDESVEIRPHDGIIYISHMALRERLWDVFGPTNVAEICRERFIRNDTNEVAVDLVLMIRGVFIAEGVGTAKYYPNNPKASFGDTVESAWSDAIRRCCKKFGVGTQVWRPQYVRDWLEKYAGKRQTERGMVWFRRRPEDQTAEERPAPKRKTREYTLKASEGAEQEHPMNPANQPTEDDDALPF